MITDDRDEMLEGAQIGACNAVIETCKAVQFQVVGNRHHVLFSDGTILGIVPPRKDGEETADPILILDGVTYREQFCEWIKILNKKRSDKG